MKTKYYPRYAVTAVLLIIGLISPMGVFTPVQADAGPTSMKDEGGPVLQEFTATLGVPAVPNRDPKPVLNIPKDPREPGPDSPTPLPDPLKEPSREAPPTRDRSGWTVLMSEGFEGAFPSGSWFVADNNGSVGGNVLWDDDDFKPYSGYWSAWSANGGTDGVDPEFNNYRNSMDSWMVYGPFDLSGCAAADYEFWYWNKSEANYDFFGWMQSSNGVNFGGLQLSGDQSSWNYVDVDLSYHLGDPSVWLAFRFLSDGSVTDIGTFVDNVTLWCYINDAPDPWTFMVYLDGDNNLESAAINDFMEMSGVGSSTDVNIVVQLDRISGYDTSYGDWTGGVRYRITSGMTPTEANGIPIGEPNMGDPETLLHFINWAKAAYPANNYALVLWDHGSGWKMEAPPPTKGIAFDDTSGDHIDMPELRSVLNTVTSGGANRIEILGMDACLMAMIEVDNQIKPYADIRVGSQETEPNDGWPYDTLLSTLVANPSWTPTQVATDIVDDYYASYGNNNTQSAVNLGSPYTTLNTAVNNFAIALINNGAPYISQIETARIASQDFTDTSFIDLWDFADWVNINVNNTAIDNAATAVKNAVMSAVINEHSGASWPWAQGISVYFPTAFSGYDTRYDGSSGFLQFTANTQWDEWLRAYYNYLNYPGAFNKTSPANGATSQPVNLTLYWNSSSGATSYQYCLDTSVNGACNASWLSNGTSTSKSLSGLSPSTTYEWHVRALNSYGTTYSNMNTYWTFTTGDPPPMFNKTSPANGASNQPLSLTLYWNSSSGATSYEYCLDTSVNGACNASWLSNGTSTSKALSGLSPSTTYEWHVRALNSYGATYSNSNTYWTFTTGSPPPMFNKTSPANGASDQPLSLTLLWNSSSGATSYQYCLDTSVNGACNTSWIDNGTSTSKSLSGLSLGTTYEWHVRATNAFGTTYSNSNTYWTFTTGSPPPMFNKSSPANGASDQLLSLTLYWNSSSGATSYEYCLDTSVNGACNASWINNGVSTSKSLSGLSLGTTYEWHVRAINTFGTTYSNSNTYWTFTTGTPPPMFNKTSPANGASNQPLSLTLQWSSSSGATSYEYCLDTSVNGACNASWISNGTSTSKALSGLSPSTTYEWHVRAINAFGTTYSNSNTYWAFTTGSPPGAFNKTSPANGASDQPLSLTLLWNSSSGATSYQYCLDTSTNGACNASWIDNGTSTSKSLSGLSLGTTYEWHVRATNAFGTTYSNSDTYWTFTTGSPPGAFNKTSPANGASDQLLSLTLQWSSSSGATSYEYCLDTSVNGACNVSWINNGTSTSKALSGLSPSTTYEWHVRAINAFGTTYSNSNTYWTFTTGNLPGAFNKSSPANGATDQPLSLTLYWNSSSGATYYEYCYDTTDDDSCSFWNNNGTMTSISISGLSGSTTYYWQVRAGNSDGITYATGGDWWSFRTEPVLQTMTLLSQGSKDGWILESGEFTNKGGTLNKGSRVINLGDSLLDQQYRAILSFNTSSLPDNAVITKVTLKIKKSGIVGTNPFKTHGNIYVDIRKGAFSGNPALQAKDFQARATKNKVAVIKNTSNKWFKGVLTTGKDKVNLTGLTQFRLRFKLDDNDDNGNDYIKYYSGNAGTTSRPKLIIEYYVP